MYNRLMSNSMKYLQSAISISVPAFFFEGDGGKVALPTTSNILVYVFVQVGFDVEIQAKRLDLVSISTKNIF